MIVDNKLVCDFCDNNKHHVYQDINWHNSKATYTNDICEQCLIDRSPNNHYQRSQEDIVQERERIMKYIYAKRKRGRSTT
jgi:uncharacterized protein CbrC (UPF0167 family)